MTLSTKGERGPKKEDAVGSGMAKASAGVIAGSVTLVVAVIITIALVVCLTGKSNKNNVAVVDESKGANVKMIDKTHENTMLEISPDLTIEGPGLGLGWTQLLVLIAAVCVIMGAYRASWIGRVKTCKGDEETGSASYRRKRRKRRAEDEDSSPELRRNPDRIMELEKKLARFEKRESSATEDEEEGKQRKKRTRLEAED